MIVELVVIVLFVIFISALTSLFEAVLYSVPQSHVEVLAKSGKFTGRILKGLKKEIERPIAAILTLNTISTTMGAAVAGATAAAVFDEYYLGWFSAFFTIAFLLFSEIIPKTIGVAHAKAIAPWIAWPLHWLVKILSPVTWLLRIITRLIGSRNPEMMISAEEIQAIAAMSLRAGGIDPEQEEVIRNILQLSHKYVRDVMTPRTVTFSLSEHLTVNEAKNSRSEWNHYSRVPVYDKDPDDVVGIVLRKDVFSSIAKDEEHLKLTELMYPVHFVPESATLEKVMISFLERRQHLFVVVDEYGSMTGVISLEDILEEIVGREIIDETDPAKNMRELARHKRRVLVGH